MIDIPSPFQSAFVIGHEASKALITAAYESNRMPHAWIITGQEGIGKTTLAVHMAHMLLSKGENNFTHFNPAHPAARLIAAGAHPDLFVLRCPLDEKTGAVKNIIPVEEARKVAPFLRMTASHGSGRVALVDEAHKLNRNAQNALLKIIEEPTAGSVIIMTATTSALLLPTIRSRCHVLALDALKPQELETILMRVGVELPVGEHKARFLDYAEGSAGRGLKLLQTESLQLFDELETLLVALPALDIQALHRIADAIGKKADQESFEIVTSLLTLTLRRAVRAAALGQVDSTGFAAKMAQGGRLDKLLDLCEKTEDGLRLAEGLNLDKKLAFINAIVEIKRCAE